MAEQLLEHYKKDVSEFALVPSDGGRFEIELDDVLIYSKLAEKRYPDFAEIRSLIDTR